MKLKTLLLKFVVLGISAVFILFGILFYTQIATSEKVRSMCVSGLAKGMKFQQEAKETLQNMREEAEDMCYEAKSQLNDEEE